MTQAAYRELAECKSCLEVPRNTILYVCPRNHNLCHSCFLRFRPIRCQLSDCKLAYDRPLRRNVTAEKLIYEAAFVFSCKHMCGEREELRVLEDHERRCGHRRLMCPKSGCGQFMPAFELAVHDEQHHKRCGNNTHGCQFSGLQELLASHERSCSYRWVPCPIMACPESVVKEFQVLEHLRIKHAKASHAHNSPSGKHFAEFKLDQENKTSGAWPPKIIKFAGNFFFLQLCRSEAGRAVYVWVSLLGCNQKANEYVVSLKVNGNDQAYKRKCRVFDIDANKELIFADQGGDCLQLNVKQFRGCVARGILNVTCTIVARGDSAARGWVKKILASK